VGCNTYLLIRWLLLHYAGPACNLCRCRTITSGKKPKYQTAHKQGRRLPTQHTGHWKPANQVVQHPTGEEVRLYQIGVGRCFRAHLTLGWRVEHWSPTVTVLVIRSQPTEQQPGRQWRDCDTKVQGFCTELPGFSKPAPFFRGCWPRPSRPSVQTLLLVALASGYLELRVIKCDRPAHVQVTAPCACSRAKKKRWH
jgi:hypothetical protein